MSESVQWNLSITDTIGELSVIEVSLISREVQYDDHNNYYCDTYTCSIILNN